MADFTQDGRAFRLTTPLGADTLLLQGFTAREAISAPFLIGVDAVSSNSSIPAADLLMKPVSLAVYDSAGAVVRQFHGLVRSFTRTGRRAGLLTGYHLEVAPAFWFLSLINDIRIFQDTSAPDIVQEVLEEQGVEMDVRLRKQYPVREYCVQYRESSFDFVSRLLESEGIHYFFEHEAGRHRMVLGDSAGDLQPCPGQTTAQFSVPGEDDPGGDVVTAFTRNHRMHSAGVTLTDFDPWSPTANTSAGVTDSDPEAHGEYYDYPGGHVVRTELERYADLRLRAREQEALVGRGAGNCRAFVPGTRFDLAGHEDRSANGAYLLTQVTHSAWNGSYAAGDHAEADYSNNFTVVAHPNDFRPPRTTPVPVVHGPQTATVVGPADEEIHVDARGRVRIQFHWDRVGQRDETSTCWVRVMTNTAGNRWGMIHLPRINQEVVVTFLEGDPDRPLVTGAVYNGMNEPPYPLPEQGLVQGLKTRSSKGGEGYNELILDDRKARELIRMHAQRNLQVKVLNTESREIGKHQLALIKGARGVLVEGETQLQLEGPDEEGEVGEEGDWDVPVGDVLRVVSNRLIYVEKAQGTECQEGFLVKVHEGDNYSEVVKGNHQEVVTEGDHSVEVETGNQSILVDTGDQLTEVTQGNIDMKAKSGGITIDGSNIITLKSGGASIKMGPTGGIELKFGSSSITLNSQGVEIKGMNVKAKAELEAAIEGSISAKLKGGVMAEVKGVMTQVEASGMLVAKGALTKIN